MVSYLFVYIISGVFYDQSDDDIVEYIWGMLAEIATHMNVVSAQKMIHRNWVY